MSISSTATDLRASERFMLVRLTPARYVSEDLASAGGGVYTLDWTYPIAKVERNGTQLTETTTNPPGTNDYWYWDGSTFKVKLASAPSASNVVVIYYYLFYTNHRSREAYTTPTDSATTLREWQPRLTTLPNITQSIRNVVSGVFSISASSVELINADYAFQDYLTANDSFSGKDVDIWLCLNDTSEIQKVFKGRISGVRLSEKYVTVAFLDAFSALDKPCYMGDTAAEAIYSRENFPDLDPAKEGVPCKYVAASGSRFSYRSGYLLADPTVPSNVEVLDAEYAACTTQDSSASSTANLNWGLCRVSSGGLATQTFGSIVRVYDGFGVGIAIAYVTGHTFDVGETLTYTTTGSKRTTIVRSTEAFSYGGNDYNLVIEASSGDFTTSSTITANPKIAVYVQGRTSADGSQWAVINTSGIVNTPTITYDLNTDTTSGSNKYINIDFVDNYFNFETTYISPDTHDVLFRVVPSDDSGHESVLKRIIESAGVTTNAASFTSAGGALDMACRYTIPYFDETDYKTHIEYAEDLLSNTLGVVYQNGSQEAVYELLDSEAGGTTIDRNVYLQNSLSVDVDYNDVVTQIVAYNPHAIELSNLDAADPSSSTAEDTVAKYLHGAKTARFRHLMTTLANRITAILAVRSSPRILYRFDTATKNLTSLLNDPVTLEADAALGGSGSKDLSIVSIDNSGSKTTVEAIDLEVLA